MTLKKAIFSVLLLTGLIAQGANAAQVKTDSLHGSKVSLATAKSQAFGAYSDGTNIVLVNFSHDPVDIEIPDLGAYPHLGSVNSGDNVYYLYSAAWYDNVWVNVYDSLDGYLLASGTVDNPGTMEIRDSYALKVNGAHARPRVAIKHGV